MASLRTALMLRIGTAYLVSMALVAMIFVGAHTAKSAPNGGEPSDWILICSSRITYFINLRTGERRENPASPDNPKSTFACHNALNRRETGEK